MRALAVITLMSFLHLTSAAQKPGNGIYTFEYCDLEYNRCLGPCKVVIKADSIWIYASSELAAQITLTRPGDELDRGIILKHKTGKWIVGKSPIDAKTTDIPYDGPAILDFRKKQYWRY